MTISLQLRIDLLKLLRSDLVDIKDDKETSIGKLVENLNAAKGDLALQEAWLPILKKINPSYYMARDNTIKFDAVAPLIDSLVAVAAACISQLDGKLADNAPLAHEAAQLHFKVSQYYSLDSTDPKNYDICSHWLKRAGDFIQANGLTETKDHAVWHNLVGGHKSRGFVIDSSENPSAVFPHSSVEHFQEAVRIHKEKLSSKVEKPKDSDLRHVLMCLASTTAQEAMNKVIISGKVTADTKSEYDKVKAILSTLTDEVLVLLKKNDDESITIVPDPYRRAGCLQAKSYTSLLEGNFKAACTEIDEAAETMRVALPTTGAKGQLSAILNDVRYVHGAFMTATSLESEKISEGKFEAMYANAATADLKRGAYERFSRLAKAVLGIEQPSLENATVSEEYRAFITPAFAAAKEKSVFESVTDTLRSISPSFFAPASPKL